jgi:uncharacterized protein (DUF2249 family)
MNGREALDAPVWQAGDATTHIDVRGLPPPRPLVQIMQLVSRLNADAVLIVHHDRDPLLLYPELAQIGWWAERIDGDPGEVRLRLTRSAA